MSSVPPSFVPPSRLLLGPGPSPIDPRILQAFTRPTLGHLDPVFLKLMDEVRGMLKQVFRTQNELTFPVSGTGTAGMETCLVNLIEPGDEVVVCVQGYFGARMADIAGRAGGKVTVLNAKWGEGFEPAQVEPALKGKNVKVLCIVQAETSTGYNQPVKEFADLAHRHGALIVVDAVTSTGGIPVEVDAWGIDIAYSATQKCLGVPPGLAPLTVSERARERFVERSQSWYLDLRLISDYVSADAGRRYHHTAPTAMIAALHAGLGHVLDEGLEQAWTRHAECGEALQAGFEKLGFRLLAAEGHRLPQLTSLAVPDGVDEGAVRRALLDGFGIEIGGGLGAWAGSSWRIGCMGDSAQRRNVTLLLSAVAELLGR